MNELKRHYILVFPFIFSFFLCGLLLPLKIIWVVFFTLGFLWPWGLLTPELREKVRSPRYRFSFFRLMFWLEDQIEGQIFFETKISLKFISRVLGPLLFSLTLSLVGGIEVFLSCLLGLILGESWLYINKKFYPKAYRNKEPSLSENSL
ncbi:MAG: hypothetical protein ACJAT2_002317 [Bacteriovoracaceae bacterium]|jgi:hypothetical protein